MSEPAGTTKSTNPNNVKGRDSYTPLMRLVKKGDLVSIKAMLLEDDIDIDVLGPNDTTALMLAAKAGHFDIVEAFLSKGVELDIVDKYDWNALMLAASAGHFKIAKKLFSAMDEKFKSKDLVPSNQSQKFLKSKIIIYLLASKDRDEKFIEQFTKGYCSGMSAL